MVLAALGWLSVLLLTDKEKRKDNVAHAAGDPDRNEQEEGNQNTFHQRERGRLCPQDMEKRRCRAQQHMSTMREMGTAGEKGGTDSQQCRQVDDQGHFHNAEVWVGVLHSKK